ncbi:MAG TPA: sigma-70 family RNA polymerase sigma factor [Actinomycetota bacterium]|nr:sigma-70 family RNA polymerase sigma factor [Actinomycetota bacterium]
MASATAIDKKEEFRTLAKEQLPRLYSLARRLVGEDAEDVVQDALMKAYRGFDQLADPEAAPAWLASIVVNSSRDLGRARAREPEKITVEEADGFSLYRKIAHEDPFPYSDSLHIDFLERFGSDDVRNVLLLLPEIYRIPLVLVHMQGFSTKEVAKMTDAPLGTVLARLHRGRKLFEKTMWEYAERKGLLNEENT